MIEVRNLYKKFDGPGYVLKDVSFKVCAGEFVVVLGRSGAGKSTLLRCLNYLTMPTSGSLLLDGQLFDPGSKKNLQSLRKRVAMIFQDYNLVGRLSVLMNVIVGRLSRAPFIPSLLMLFPKRDLDMALSVLAEVGLEGKAMVRADSLSGGQQQRVGIARALAQEPELILADEPIGSLDPKTSREILCCLRHACRKKGIAVLCSLHQVEYALEFATRIIGLSDGRVAFDGPPDQVTADVIESIYPGIGSENIARLVHRMVKPVCSPALDVTCAG